MVAKTKQEILAQVVEKPQSPRLRGSRLKRIRNLGNLTRKELSEKSGVNLHTLKGWENGRFGGLSVSGAKLIIKYLSETGVHCSLAWLLDNTGRGPTINEDQNLIKITSYRTEHNNHPEVIKNELSNFKKMHTDTNEFLVADDNMQPFFQSGDYVAGIKRFGRAIEMTIGHDCIIETADGLTLFRQLRRGDLVGTYTLICHNPKYNTNDSILSNVKLVSAAPIIWHRKKDI